VDQFFLVGREETLGDGVVITDSGPTQGTADLVLRAELRELARCVLGRFNRSSQHHLITEVGDGTSGGLDEVVDGSVADEVTGGTGAAA
jgi:hypothetical protein